MISDVCVVWTFCRQHNSNALLCKTFFFFLREIYVPLREHRCWSSAIAIIWKAALQERLAHVHKGEERGSVHGKIRTLDNYMIHIEV